MSGASARTPTLSVVVVSYRSEAHLGETLRSVPEGAQCVVVEQSATGSAAACVNETRPEALYVRAGGNRGFGAGCNIGAAAASGEVLLFLNPDATLDPGSAEKLAVAAVRHGALVGPRILDGDGTEATKARKWSAPWRDALGLVMPDQLLPARLHRDIPRSWTVYQAGGAVPYVQGSCMAIPRSLFFSVGGFDERYFLYGEEESLSHRVAMVGGSTRLEPAATVRHIGQTSTESVGVFASGQILRSQILIYRERLGARRAAGGAFALFLAVTILTATSPLRRWKGPRRTWGAEWSRAAYRAIPSGLFASAVTPPRDLPPGDVAWPAIPTTTP